MIDQVTQIEAATGIEPIEKRLATVHLFVPKGGPIKVPITAKRIADMAQPAGTIDVKPHNQPGLMASDVPAVTLFNELWIGDRFEVLNDAALAGVTFTKTRHDQARRHSTESQELRSQGFGYIDDPIVNVAQSVIVRFIPVQ